MALKRTNTMDKSVEDLEKEITCAICHDHYTEPKVLPCLHYYCKQCIHWLTLRTGLDKPFSCPECRKDSTLPRGSVDELPTAFFVNRMKSVHSKLERAHGKVEAKCEMCSGDRAKAFCRQCTQFICDECVKQHHRMKAFTGHKVVSLDELKEGAKEITMKESPHQTCKKHDEAMKIYCFDCKSLICRDCTIKDHFHHDHEFIKISAPEMKKKLIEQLDPLNEVKVSLSHAVEEIKITKGDIETQGRSVAEYIDSSFDELQKIIENRRQELLNETALKVTEKLERLSDQEKSLSTTCEAIRSVIEYTEQWMQHSTNEEVMCKHVEIETRIKKEIEEYCQLKMNLDPVEDVDVGVEMMDSEYLKQLFETKAMLSQLPIDPAKCTARSEGAETEMNKMCGFIITPRMTNGRHTKQECEIDCKLNSLISGANVECIIDRKANEYRISYIPTVSGSHELTVAINEEEIAGSPFTLVVTNNFSIAASRSSPVITRRRSKSEASPEMKGSSMKRHTFAGCPDQ